MQTVLAGWKQISATLAIGELTQAGLDAKLTEARTAPGTN
jgi:hypothetical protein